MIFNKESNGTKELRELTGNYYANNDFGKVAGEIELATEELSSLVGDAVVELADEYYNNDGVDADMELVRKVQRPIAILATLRMYQKNDLSHEDDGRKFKMATDNSEKLPWEWQLDRDDALHLEEYYKAVDALIRYLNKKGLEVWTESNLFKLAQTLIIRSGEMFDTYFPIEKSERTYLILVPFIREAQMLTVKRAYGSGWDGLLAEKDVPETDAHFAACKAVALLAMGMALRRLSLSLIPGGVIRKFMAESGIGESEPATLDDVDRVAQWMTDDAATWVDEMKRMRDGGQVPEYDLLPKNDGRNKYCRL